MPRGRLIVLKFGGSVLADRASLDGAATEISRRRAEGAAVVAVVSAFAGVTDGLVRAEPASRDPRLRAAALALGEAESAAALALRLDASGIPAATFSPAGLGLIAEGDPLDAMPARVDTGPIVAALAEDRAVVVPGFTALDGLGRTVVLGRGGSDLSAIFLAAELGARCRLVKDVDGLYDRDPAGPTPARRFAEATWADALATDGTIVQHKAVRHAASRGQRFEIGGLFGDGGTLVGAATTRYADADRLCRSTA